MEYHYGPGKDMKMQKTIQQIELAKQPPLLTEIFNLLQQAGAEYFALFGGAPRDADFAARKNQPPKINDYDLRIWLEPENYDENVRNFIKRLSAASGESIREESSPGTGRPLYRFNYMGVDLDVSIRAKPEGAVIKSVAIERAGDSDIGISSVAIDPLKRAWATSEYISDQDNNTLSLYPIEDAERRENYARRMQGKFPGNALIRL